MRLVSGALAIVALLAGLLFGWLSFAILAGETAWIQFLYFRVTWPAGPILAVTFLVVAGALGWMAVSGRALPRRT